MATLTPEKQLEAIKLYESGLSMQEVANYFEVTLGAVLYTLRHHKISRRNASESNALVFEKKPMSYLIKKELSPDEENLKLAAIMLYWAEGYKVGKSSIDFANSDPNMALIFRKFLSEICQVDEKRIRCSLYCYEGQDIEALHNFWSTFLRIPREQFTKPYIKKAAEPTARGPRMTQGLVHLRYSDKKLLGQILAWIEEYQQKCVGGGVVNRGWL